VRGEKKGFASLRFCVSSLHRDHANLLCIFKRLFNVAARRLDTDNSKKQIYKLLYIFGQLYCGTSIIQEKEGNLGQGQNPGHAHFFFK